MNLFGPADKWNGMFGIHTTYFTLHIFPRGSYNKFGYSSEVDENEEALIGGWPHYTRWSNFDFGPIFSISWSRYIPLSHDPDR